MLKTVFLDQNTPVFLSKKPTGRWDPNQDSPKSLEKNESIWYFVRNA